MCGLLGGLLVGGFIGCNCCNRYDGHRHCGHCGGHRHCGGCCGGCR